MTYLFLLGGLFLGWSFGRNNLSNVFGVAIGTRMVTFKTAALFASVFILLGSLLSSSGTTDSVLKLAEIPSASSAFLISISIALTILIAGRFGVPVSIVQSSMGALIGWNVVFEINNNWSVIIKIVSAWFYSPVVAALFAMLGFCGMRRLLEKIKIPLLYRDILVRTLLIISGAYSAYFLGANNMPAIAGPYLSVNGLDPMLVFLCVGLAIALGALIADRRVIETVSSGLYPLSPMEALVVVLASGMTLCCFSGSVLRNILSACHLPSFPLVPIPASGVLIGSIIGVGLVKGQAGIHWPTFAKVLTSWILIPVVSCLICWIVLAILISGGTIL